MIKTLIMIECDQCHAVFPNIIDVVNHLEVPLNRLGDTIFDAVDAGWHSPWLSTFQICPECRYQDDVDNDEHQKEEVLPLSR